MRKKKKFINYTFTVLSVITVVSAGTVGGYILSRVNRINNPEIVRNPEVQYSKFYDNSGNLIKSLGTSEDNYIKYEDLPPTLIDALLAVEDISFFHHDGFDSRRIIGSLINNIFNSNIEGASTITQQLAKNLFLSPEKTVARKIDELLLSLKLEGKFTKEEILEYYFNLIFFDGSEPGIVNAARKYFRKKVSALTLAESALLIGMVKSPTIYNPLRNPKKSEERRNIVLKSMLKYDYISDKEYSHAVSVKIEDMLPEKEKTTQTFSYQSYLDCCYKEIKKLTGLDPYSSPLIVETFMEPEIQSYVDLISEGKVFNFTDSDQQIALALIDNKTGNCVALSGGRNYAGEKLYNRAYDMLRGPASTIKPIFQYALAIENLSYNAVTTLHDQETSYPSGETVHNAGGSYAGELTLTQALGYSKNTTAIQTLLELNRTLGTAYLQNYLTSIGIMDQGDFTFSYGLGGMAYGVSPLNLAGAYAMLANGGKYRKPALIKKITSAVDGSLIYEYQVQPTTVLSEKTAYMVTDILTNIVEDDFVGLKSCKPNNVKIAAKTGTGAYDQATINKLGYPQGVDKDIWLAGFSPDYSLSIWSGFDTAKKDGKTYFFKGDSRRKVTKEVFRSIMNKVNIKNDSFTVPEGLIKVPLVKYADGNFLPNAYIPQTFIQDTYVKDSYEFPVYPLPSLPKSEPVTFVYKDKIAFYLKPLESQDKLYEKIYGSLGYYITIKQGDNIIDETFVTGQNYEFYWENSDTLSYEIKTGYEKLKSLYGESFINTNDSILTPW